MRILCKGNSGQHLPEKMLTQVTLYTRQTEFGVEIGTYYNVYAVMMREGELYFGVCSHSQDEYFRWKPEALFELVDGRIPRSWVFSKQREGASASYIFSIDLISGDAAFYDRLVEQDRTTRELFVKYREAIDLEFSYEGIENVANRIDGDWIMCPRCGDSWQTTSGCHLQLVRCPGCETILGLPVLVN